MGRSCFFSSTEIYPQDSTQSKPISQQSKWLLEALVCKRSITHCNVQSLTLAVNECRTSFIDVFQFFFFLRHWFIFSLNKLIWPGLIPKDCTNIQTMNKSEGNVHMMNTSWPQTHHEAELIPSWMFVTHDNIKVQIQQR